MTFFAFVVSVLMGVGSFVYTYSEAGYDSLPKVLLLFGAIWLYAGWRRWRWFSSLGILVVVALAGFGLWAGLSPGWMVSGSLGGLLAWDLAEFMRRLRFAAGTDDVRGLERRHLARLTIFTLLGLTLASIALLIRLEFSFEWVMLLTLVAVLGVIQMVGWLRKEE